MTKGEKIDRELIVDYAGSGCVGNMGWETPYIDFEGGYRWQSDTIGELWYSLRKGDKVAVRAFAYPHKRIEGLKTLRRVKVTRKGGFDYGQRN